jgi:hypothetical protein
MGLFNWFKNSAADQAGNILAIQNAEKFLLTLPTPLTEGQRAALASTAKDLTRRIGYGFDVTTMATNQASFSSAVAARGELLTLASTPFK